ncbi:ABC transporter permease [Aquisphaera insulae]|uniref:ABC transporter permease n=1 Tax=Aquisphaera insulae TaxID=2712864 RepID=UPI0034E1C9DA
MIRLETICKEYLRGDVPVPVLKGVSLTIREGEMVALMGASGSGKTTLINLLGFLDRPTRGNYWFEGADVSGLDDIRRAFLRSRRIGFVFQSFNLLPRMSALENVMLPMLYGAHGLSSAECRSRAERLLERVGLAGRMDHEPSRLSGGEQQRVAIARALMNQGSLLIADEPTGNLDSRTGEEILALFQELNRQEGLTILLVTHDAGVASHADRTIRVRDGRISEDGVEETEVPAGTMVESVPASILAPVDVEAPPLRPAPFLRKTSPADERETAGGSAPTPPRPGLIDEARFLSRTVATSFRSLRRNAMRSALTTLGIIIGVGSLLAIAEIGQGAWTAIRALLTKTGVDNIVIQAGAASRNGVSLGSGSIKTLTPEDAELIERECPSIDSLAPLVFTRRQVVSGSANWVPATFIGTTPGYLRVREWEDLEEGEPFTDEDVSSSGMVCLLGHTIARELFGKESPVGREVHVSDVPLRVIGVLARKGADIIGEDQDDILVAPWTTVKYRISAAAATGSPTKDALHLNPADDLTAMARRYPRGQADPFPTQSAIQMLNTPTLQRLSNVDSILVRAESTEEIPAAMEQIENVLRESHRIKDGEPNDFSVRDFTEVVGAVKGTVGLVAGLLLCVALISLLVGGIGIMNIMLVSVTERYREIGLRMAVGARSSDILRQFLVESVVLCILGGAVGIALGRSASTVVRLLALWPTEPSTLAVIVSVSVSVTIGMIFGYYPAWKASRLDPIEALRFE